MDLFKPKTTAKPTHIKNGRDLDSDHTTPLGSPPSQSPSSYESPFTDGSPHRQPASYATIPLPGSSSTRSNRRPNDKYPSISSGRNKIFGLDTGALKNLAGKSEEPFSSNGVPHLTVEAAPCHDPTLIFGEPKSRTAPPEGSAAVPKPASVRSVKKKKKLVINPTSTPADIFAATISDAMVEAEDSETDEGFVRYNTASAKRLANYGHPPPHSAQDPNLSDYVTSPGPVSMRPSRSQSSYLAGRDSREGDFRAVKSSRKLSSLPGEDANLYTAPHRPPGRAGSFGPNGRDGLYLPFPNGEFWEADDESTPLFDKKRYPHRYRPCCRLTTLLTLGGCILLLFGLSIMIFVFSTRPLTDVGVISITNVLAAEKELIFDVQVKARNRNFLTVTIQHAGLGVFARPSRLPNSSSFDPIEFLGRVYHLDSFLSFPHSSYPSTSSTQLRVQHPGQQPGDSDPSGNIRWARIIRHPYQLTLRGVLKYTLAPWFYQTYTAPICAVVIVDPKTTAVIQAPEGEGLCSGTSDDDDDGRGGPVERP